MINTIIHGDCLEVMPRIPSASVDAVIADPPYPMIKRPYGMMAEAEWHTMMRAVVGECRRILKPNGSAVFILQPNSRKVGSMRAWLWEFMAWTAREWNQVQDAWAWNYRAIPDNNAIRGGLMRGSVKACVWLGPDDCHRDQDAALWGESETCRARRLAERAGTGAGRRINSPGGHGRNIKTVFDAVERRGGVTPYNLIPVQHGNSQRSAGAHGHPAGTPAALMNYWIRYIAPPGGLVLDPFLGSGTTALECLKLGRRYIGIDKMSQYVEIARSRAATASREPSS